MKIPERDVTHIILFVYLHTLTSPTRHKMDRTPVSLIQLKTFELELDFTEYIRYTLTTLVQNTKCVSWCTRLSVCIRLYQHTLLNCAYWCLNQPAVVSSVLLRGVTWLYHAPEQRDMAKDVSLFLDKPCGTHSL